MRCGNLIINILLVVLLLISCSKSKNSDHQNNDSVILKINASIKLRDDVRLVIEECLNKYPQYNSFVLSRSPKKLDETDIDEILSNDFLIGPAFKQSNHDKTPLLYFDFKGKRIFIKCGLEELYTDSHYQDSIYQKQLIKSGLDSVVESDNVVKKDGAVLYVYRSIYFKIGQDGNVYRNYRPDTLFLPKRFHTTVKFNPSIK
ncbi:MAG: hypothetical protein Q8908_11745 [Bacteroidota bacterium]|nr:hypothetical protein [Bacteroidota bacterium]